MKYGYARVSTDDQKAEMQHAALMKAGVDRQNIFTDKGLSGGTINRPQLKRCLKALSANDTLIVWKLDRLSRNVRDFVIMADELKERGIKLNSLSEHLDPDTTLGRAMMQIAAIFAEMERSNIRERTRAGVTAAKARGVKFGRKAKLSPQQIDHARKLIASGKHDRQEIAELFKVNQHALPGARLKKRHALSGTPSVWLKGERLPAPAGTPRRLPRPLRREFHRLSPGRNEVVRHGWFPLRPISFQCGSACRAHYLKLRTPGGAIVWSRHGETLSLSGHNASGGEVRVCQGLLPVGTRASTVLRARAKGLHRNSAAARRSGIFPVLYGNGSQLPSAALAGFAHRSAVLALGRVRFVKTSVRVLDSHEGWSSSVGFLHQHAVGGRLDQVPRIGPLRSTRFLPLDGDYISGSGAH
jgi:DNA invertase Pin-like site-specific DNA recombinase